MLCGRCFAGGPRLTAFPAWQVVQRTGGEDNDYFRMCQLPWIVATALFWLLNVPLLIFNFFPAINPLERWKVQ